MCVPGLGHQTWGQILISAMLSHQPTLPSYSGLLRVGEEEGRSLEGLGEGNHKQKIC